MGACIEKDYSGTKKKVMTGYMVSVGATIRADKICTSSNVLASYNTLCVPCKHTYT